MNKGQDKQPSKADSELQQEIISERKFSLEEAIARLAGPGGLKGESPISRLQQAEFQLQAYLRSHLNDPGCASETIILRHVMGSELMLHNLDQPFVVLASYCQKLLASDQYLKEFVREADMQWGQTMLERPYFEREGSPPHPDDPYTLESARRLVTELFQTLANELHAT